MPRCFGSEVLTYLQFRSKNRRGIACQSYQVQKSQKQIVVRLGGQGAPPVPQQEVRQATVECKEYIAGVFGNIYITPAGDSDVLQGKEGETPGAWARRTFNKWFKVETERLLEVGPAHAQFEPTDTLVAVPRSVL